MKQITNKQYEEWQKYNDAVIHGRILTPEFLRGLCNSFNNDPKAIGEHILTCLNKIEQDSKQLSPW